MTTDKQKPLGIVNSLGWVMLLCWLVRNINVLLWLRISIKVAYSWGVQQIPQFAVRFGNNVDRIP